MKDGRVVEIIVDKKVIKNESESEIIVGIGKGRVKCSGLKGVGIKEERNVLRKWGERKEWDWEKERWDDGKERWRKEEC